MLPKFSAFPGVVGPTVTVVSDGYGYGLARNDAGSAIAAARTPTLDRLFACYPNVRLRAHGKAVGMPSNGDMVGHTGNFRAATMAIEAVDLAVSRLLAAVDAAGLSNIAATTANLLGFEKQPGWDASPLTVK